MAGVCLLGLDLGTTTCRVMAFDERGSALAAARREVLTRCDAPGEAEVHADDWWQAAVAVLCEISAELAARGIAPVALGLTGLMHALVPIGVDGRVLAPSMLWMDMRCQGEVDWLNGEGRPLLEAAAGAGARAGTTPSLPRLRWMAHHRPDLVARASRFLLPKDYIRFRLTGAIATDPTDAGGTMLYDSRAGGGAANSVGAANVVGAWSAGLVALAGIRIEQLPPILPSDALAGYVTADAAAATGLPAGLPVAAGMSDTAATRLGCPNAPGDALIYMGTAAWMHWTGPRDRAAAAQRGRILATISTGGALRWLRDVLAGTTAAGPDSTLSYDALLDEATGVPAGAEGLLFLPHLSGERGPVADADARGSLLGLSLCHGRGHLVRAVLEGTCCHMRWLLEAGGATQAERLWVAGGAAHSPLWMQILANTLGRTVHTPQQVECGALGAAALGAVAAGLYPSREAAAARMAHPGDAYAPEPALVDGYGSLYARWREAEAREGRP